MMFSCKLTVDPKLWDTKGGDVSRAEARRHSKRTACSTNTGCSSMSLQINIRSDLRLGNIFGNLFFIAQNDCAVAI